VLLLHIHLKGGHPQAPYLRQGPDRREIACVHFANPPLMKLLLLKSYLFHLETEPFSIMEMEPTEHDPFHQNVL
jgi:hypothetical protein